MSRNVAIVVAFLGVLASLCAQEVSVSISGTVVDTSGNPVSGVTVSLEKLGLTTTTDGNGAFAIGNPTRIRETSPERPAARLRDGILHVSLAEAGPVVVTAHDLAGRVVATRTARLEAGAHGLEPPAAGSGIRFYRIQAGLHEDVIRAIALSGSGSGNGEGAVSGTVAFPLAKQSAGSPLYDDISAVKTGYLKSYVSITTSDTSGVQVKLLPSEFPRFSFFVTSLKAMQDFSGSPNGFGGDLRFGETGAGAGLRGADKLCATIAERSLKHSYVKGWRAFLSVKSGPDGTQVDAIDRLGPGPWYDRIGRVLAPTKADLLHTSGRPANGDVTIRTDFPNEDGVLNQYPVPGGPSVDNHHFLTGSNTQGRLYTVTSNPGWNPNCSDWTTSAPVVGVRPRTGWSWSIQNRVNWISGTDEGGCGAGVYLIQSGGAQPNNPIVGSGGGYGGIYCFALTQ
jgi:hypothetical protein